MDIKKGDKIALISSNNRTEWNIMDISVTNWCCNSTIYPTISENDYEYILNHSEAIYCFVSDKEVLAKINLIKIKFRI
jgi:long-chain acyl-CoA synthetase